MAKVSDLRIKKFVNDLNKIRITHFEVTHGQLGIQFILQDYPFSMKPIEVDSTGSAYPGVIIHESPPMNEMCPYCRTSSFTECSFLNDGNYPIIILIALLSILGLIHKSWDPLQ